MYFNWLLKTLDFETQGDLACVVELWVWFPCIDWWDFTRPDGVSMHDPPQMLSEVVRGQGMIPGW